MKILRYESKYRSILRWIYEIGYCSEEVLTAIFLARNIYENKTPEAVQKDEEKRKIREDNKKKKRLQRMRRYMEEIEAEKTIESIGLRTDKRQMQIIYYLSKKGYDMVVHDLHIMDRGSVGGMYRKNEPKEIIVIYEYEKSMYRRIGKLNINIAEYDHHEFLVRFKIYILAVFKRPSIMADNLDKNDPLYSNDRADLLIKRPDGKHIAIEYERSIKNANKYLGYETSIGGRKKSHPGILASRQKDEKIHKVIVICERKNVYDNFMNILRKATTIDKKGNYLIADKYYVICREGYKTIPELLIKGAYLYTRPIYKDTRADYVTQTFQQIMES